MVTASNLARTLLEADEESAKELLRKASLMGPKVSEAVQTYVRRKARAEHPDGTFDRQGRWYPSEKERRPCCDSIRSPSGNWPYSLMLHCRTAEHVANLYNIPLADLRQAVRGR